MQKEVMGTETRQLGIERIGEMSRDGVFIYDTDRQQFRYLNEAFAAIFRFEKRELIESPKMILPFIRSEDSDYVRHAFLELRKNGVLSGAEFRLQLDLQTLVHVCCDAYSLEDEGLVAGFVKDVTKAKEHEDYIINYGAKKDTLLDMMTHNLSGPLTLSQNILRWMQQNYREKAPGDVSSQLRLIQENTQECLDIVNDFLKEEHLASEKIYVKKTRFDVLERIMNTLDKLIATNKNKKFRIISDLKDLNITTDSVKFFQIIHNLVSNSIKFTPDNGQIDIIVEETPESFVIRVRDNGIGIPLNLQHKLFDNRSSAGRAGLDNEKSNGIGLSIVKKLVEMLEGRVYFETEENKGSTFSIELPKDGSESEKAN